MTMLTAPILRPSWCSPDAQPVALTVQHGGTVHVWECQLGPQVQLVGEDRIDAVGRTIRSVPRVRVEPPESGWTAGQARRVARELAAAAGTIERWLDAEDGITNRPEHSAVIDTASAGKRSRP